MSMKQKKPSGVRLFYLHVDNTQEIKSIWKGLLERFNVSEGDKDAEELIKSTDRTHDLTNVTSIESGKVRLTVSLYRNIAIISAAIYKPGSPKELLRTIALEDLTGVTAAIGGAIVLILKKDDPKEVALEVKEGYIKIETKAGTLYQFEEKIGRKEHIYALTSRGNLVELGHFISSHLPLFDFSIHKLHMERDYFKNQRKWVMEEKVEIDKIVGDILHKRIFPETLNPENIGTLEKEIDILSTKYSILVNDGHLIRKARTTLEGDIEEVYNRLADFTQFSPEDGLTITRYSTELKKKLLEDETSISYAIKNTKTAIDIVRTNVDLLRSRENIFLQEQAISFQVAAGVLEFIIIFYYSIASWEHLIGVERLEFIAPPVRFFSVFLFATFSVILTHFVGESYKEKWKINKGMIISGIALILIFLYIVLISIETGTLHSA